MVFFVFTFIFSVDAIAEENETNWLQRETLTGNWGGFRNQLVEKGIKLDIEFSEYYQGMFSGTGYDEFKTGGRADILTYFDTEKLGLWEGGIHTHLTYRSGDLYKSGKNGQCIYVSLKKDMAVAWFSNMFNNSPWLPVYARTIVKHSFQNINQ